MSSDNRVFHGPSAATEWRYLAEGGAHIILRYFKSADQTLTCKVLRVRKCARAGDSDESVPMYSRSVSSLCFRDAELWAGFPALSMGERSELQMRPRVCHQYFAASTWQTVCRGRRACPCK